MSESFIITEGLGLTPGSPKYLVTLGYLPASSPSGGGLAIFNNDDDLFNHFEL